MPAILSPSILNSLYLFAMNEKRRLHRFYRNSLTTFCVVGLFFFTLVDAYARQKPNIIFIVVDDLRPELNCYGKTQIISPNIDGLADEGLVFTRAYCNVPVCGASRASLLTGLYPTPSRFTNYGSRVEKDAPGIVSLPGHFKNNGYYTTTLGKIFHHPDDGLSAWSELPYRPDYPNSLKQQELWRDYQSDELSWTKEKDLPLGASGPAWEAADVDDSLYYDGKTTRLTLHKLEQLAKLNKPFFFGLGFIRPHLPFNAPKKYWDMYDPSGIVLADNPYMPTNAPRDAWHNYRELRGYTNISNDTVPIPDDTARKLRHGYFACVSFVDAQVGLVVNKLKELNLYDNTIIVIIGDHGWSLGEHTLWCKHSCFNNALRTTMIIKAPGFEQGAKTSSLVSFVDLYPTLCELAELERPGHLGGRSFLPVLKDTTAVVNEYVFARWQNGESVKSDRYLYTRYYGRNGEVSGEMLYDHESDPDENNNVVGLKENLKVVEELKKALENHFKER